MGRARRGPAPPAPTVAPFGSWVSPIRVDDLVADVVGSCRAMARRRRRLLDRGSSRRGRPPGAGPAVGRRHDGRPDAPAIRRPHASPRVRRRVVRGRRWHGRLLALPRRPAVPPRPGRRNAGRHHARGAVPLRRPALRPRAAPVLRGPRGSRRRRPGGGGHRRHRPRWRARAARPRRAARTSWRRRASPRTARPSPGSSGITPTCPGTRRDSAPRRSLADGSLGPSDLAAGGPEESIVQPEWSPEGVLHLVSDRTGWWNLYRLLEGPAAGAARSDGGRVRRSVVDPRSLELRVPAGRLDRRHRPRRRSGPDHPRASGTARRRGRFGVHRTRRPARRRREPWSPSRVHRPRPRWSSPSTRRPSRPRASSAGRPRSRRTRAPISTPESIAFESTDGRTAYALYYPPSNAAFTGPADERPPLVVRSHGGPTSNASSALNLDIQFLTSRGIALVDVDYGGSTGYGRAYRRMLEGAWGVVDVDDCVAAARFLVVRGDVDGTRLAIEGGSAGGFTTLAALAFRDLFAAGISFFGVGDLESLASDTHKFESRYLDRLVGPYPEAAATYRERSPVHFARPDRLPGPRPPGSRRQGRAAQSGRGDRGGARGQRHPARLPRVRG